MTSQSLRGSGLWLLSMDENKIQNRGAGSQSLRGSGLWLLEKRIDELQKTTCGSQSLRGSGLWLRVTMFGIGVFQYNGRNPFVVQVFGFQRHKAFCDSRGDSRVAIPSWFRSLASRTAFSFKQSAAPVCRNPFVVQVFGFHRDNSYDGRNKRSQSLRGSGLWLPETIHTMGETNEGRNPFVVQVFGFGGGHHCKDGKLETRGRNPFVVQVFGFSTATEGPMK